MDIGAPLGPVKDYGVSNLAKPQAGLSANGQYSSDVAAYFASYADLSGPLENSSSTAFDSSLDRDYAPSVFL